MDDISNFLEMTHIDKIRDMLKIHEEYLGATIFYAPKNKKHEKISFDPNKFVCINYNNVNSKNFYNLMISYPKMNNVSLGSLFGCQPYSSNFFFCFKESNVAISKNIFYKYITKSEYDYWSKELQII